MPEADKVFSPEDREKIKGIYNYAIRFIPSEYRTFIEAFKNATRVFTIPAKIGNEYLLVIGIGLNKPVPSTPMYDEKDLELLYTAYEKAKAKLTSSGESQ